MRYDEDVILYMDGGTTRTRAWAAVGERVVASAETATGARDHAREGEGRRLSEEVGRVILEVERRCQVVGQPTPALAVAAGMITSAQGLLEVPHVEAPAGAKDLAGAAQCRVIPGTGGLRVVFVPGVRTGKDRATTPEGVVAGDVMRGEEVLALGLVRRRRLAEGGVLLSLGSHWKAVQVDENGRVARSVSTLSGELVESVRAHTILASALPSDWPESLPPGWLATGIEHSRRHGLPRALYEVRLLEQRVASGPVDRLAFLVGATIAASVDALVPPSERALLPVVLAGAPALTRAWETVLRERGARPLVLRDDERGAAFRAGCRAVLDEVRLPPAAAILEPSGPPSPSGGGEG